MKICVLSDIHLDYHENLIRFEACLKSSSLEDNDVCIVAGDISHKLEIIGRAFKILTEKFRHVG